MSQKILIVGAGATGGYFGARLAAAGRDVTFLVRSARAESIRKHGLQIISPHGDLTLQPKLVSAGELAAPYDVILLSVKAYALDSAMEDFAPAVGPHTMIVPMLNGMRHLDQLVARFGESPVTGGVCRISSELDSQDRIVQLTEVQSIFCGERHGGISSRMKALEQTMQGAGFDFKLYDNILQAMWGKWLMLGSLAAISCLFRGTIGDVAAVPGGHSLAIRIVAENSAIAAASGYRHDDDAIAWAHSVVAKPGSKMTASMYRDMTAGAPVEADQILGDLVRRGKELGVDCPLLEAAYVHLKVYEAHRGTD